MINIEHVTKKYGDFIAVNDLSLTVESSEFLVILGPSGCGKSTLLRLINKMIERNDGVVMINGENIDDLKGVELRKTIGYVIQNIGLFPHMNVHKNIATVPRLLKWKEDTIDQRVADMLTLVAQRIGVARAMASDPAILLMDEPFGAVDPINRLRLQKEFRKIQRKLKKTVVFVTHDTDEALLLADRICIMNKGEIVQVDSPENIVLHPKNDFVKDFFKEEGILTILSRKPAVDYAEPIEVDENPLHKDATMRDVLLKMLTTGQDRVSLSNGSISWDALLQIAGSDVHESE